MINFKQQCEDQLTLGQLIYKLKNDFKHDDIILKLYQPHCYRGYYNNLSFRVLDNETLKVSQLINLLESCIGQIFVGWKGGQYKMDQDTPLWITEDLGMLGDMIVDVKRNENNILYFQLMVDNLYDEIFKIISKNN